MTDSRTHPPRKILVLESEKLHLRFGTTPLSVLCWPKLSGFCRSSSLLVPPDLSSLVSLELHTACIFISRSSYQRWVPPSRFRRWADRLRIQDCHSAA